MRNPSDLVMQNYKIMPFPTEMCFVLLFFHPVEQDFFFFLCEKGRQPAIVANFYLTCVLALTSGNPQPAQAVSSHSNSSSRQTRSE